jgi:orotidine-5'-phosphate decarboxylase
LNFADRLERALERVRTPALVGIDPHLDLLPEPFALARDPQAPRSARAQSLEDFCKQLIDVVAGKVAAVKPQSAFFELLGADGALAWEHVVGHAHAADLLVIGDVKRSDIASTAAAYATALLEGLPGTPREHLCDAITLNPYLGSDSLAPFAQACLRCDAGLFVLVRTSNPGSGQFQEFGEPSLCERVADAVTELGAELVGECGYSSIGAVVGATHPAELQRLRARLPQAVLLLPGYGAQGASARDVRAAFPDRKHPWRGALVNSSRGVAFAYRQEQYAGRSWQDAASLALDAMIADLRNALESE